ncbi:hypothetical protein D0867_02633 [Hortaea werneckii]|uniref:Myb-like domain-containing protein n=1 Tax=Hortaea werneckii TaxID=91943 RepID=A0A3M7A4S7_HORWE|nr:hypothetical protein D0868_15983 [Hortaea werneckii]RMY22575.1 hypothetical protein D0867_02633 [Hortaea werneckii]
MGRLATNIAAAAADADNMPPTDKLPSVSLIDALLPRSLASIGSPSSKDKNPVNINPTLAMPISDYLRGMKPFRLIPIDADTGKPTDPNLGRKTYVTYYDVRKSKNGSKSIVAHKSASPSAASGNDKDGAKNAQKGENVNAGRKAQNGGGQGGEKKGADGNKASESAEEDAKLKELKDTNTSWKDIAEQMNRQPQELKTRWGQIKPTVNEQKPQQQGKQNGKGKQNQQPNQQGKKGGKPQTKEQEEAAAKKREERQKKREEASKPVSLAPAPVPAPENPKNPTTGSTKPAANLPTNAAGAGGGGGGDETRFTLSEWLTLQSDSLFTLSELQFLSELIMRDQNQTWLRIASLFYDKTGRKVHPEDIREKFERMAGMG